MHSHRNHDEGRGRHLALFGLLAAGFCASLYVNWPGHFQPDSLWQLQQGRLGRYNLWHPPVMAWLLGLADRLLRGGALFVVFDTALFYGGLFALAALARRPRALSLPLAAGIALAPLALVLQGAVLKDVLFADSALAGFAALAWAGRLWRSPALRWPLLLAAVSLLALAALARQNGLIVLPCGAAAVAALAATQGTPGRPARALLLGAAFLALGAAGDGLASAALAARSDHKPEDARHLKVLQTFDLAGALAADPALPLPALRAGDPALEAFLRREAGPQWRAAGADNLAELPHGALAIPPRGAVGVAWRDLILRRPAAYLAVRARVFAATLTTPPDADCPVIYVGVDDGDPALLRRLGMAPRDNDRDDFDEAWSKLFLQGPLYSHVFYLAVAALAAMLCAVRLLRGERTPGTIVTLALTLAGLLFAASFFALSIDCDYRFLYFLDVAAMAAALRLAAGPEPVSADG